MRAGEQGDPGAVVGAAEEAALGQVAEHRRRSSGGAAGRAPRSGRAARPARRSRRPAASPAARRRSCRSRPRPAAAGASGGPRPSSSAISSPTDAAARRSARTAAARRTGRAARRAARPRVGHGALDRGPAPGEHGLGDERLVVLEPLLGARPSAPSVSGRWIQRSASSASQQVLGLAHRRRAAPRARPRRRRARGRSASSRCHGFDPGDRRVDRDQVGHRVGGLVDVVHARLGVGQLPLVAEPLQPADEQADATRGPSPWSRARSAVLCLPVEVGEQQGLVALGPHPHLEAVRRPAGALVLVGATAPS